jgi:hypothetical protein
MRDEWNKLAQHRFPGADIYGSGQYALYNPNFYQEFGKKISLHATREECERCIYNPQFDSCVDLLAAA